jgi:hypothetical protein
MANIPVNFGGVILTAGTSITGSFAGIQCLGTGSVVAISGSTISGFKYGVALGANQSIIEATGPSFTMNAGDSIPLFITSCSLAAGSAPVLLFT